nr:MAG TPA: hypothetical protein [Bacteriophage sp.]
MDINDLIKEVKLRARFDNIDDIVDLPSDDEIKAAIYDTLDDINSLEPETYLKLDTVLTIDDTRWRRLLVLGTAANTVQTLVFDWTHNGFEADLNNGVNVTNRLSDYQTLLQSLKNEFDQRLEKLKNASLKFSSVRHFTTTGSSTNGSTLSYSRRFLSVRKAGRG